MKHLTIEGLKLDLNEKQIKKLWNAYVKETKSRSFWNKRDEQCGDLDFIAKKYAEEKTIKNIGLDWILINNTGDRVLTFKDKMVYSLNDKDIERLNKN